MSFRCGQPSSRAVVVFAVAVTVAACSYDPRDTCVDDVCRANQSPIAVITDLDAEGALRVGSDTEVIVSAARSSDPDGDVITFAWSVDATCSSKVVGALDVEQLRLDGLESGQACSVTVTVTDARNASGSATATLVVRDVGAYVTSQDACVGTYDPSSLAVQGTPETPFCSLAQGLLAARDFHLADIWLDTGTHQHSGELTLDFPVSIRGGFTSGAATWTQADGARSELLFVRDSDPIVTRVHVVDDVTAGLHDLLIRRSGPCVADCALVLLDDASLVVESVHLGDDDTNRNDAAGFAYVSLAATMSVTKQQSLSVSDLWVHGSANASSSASVVVDGHFNVTINGLTAREQGAIVTGVFSTNALNVDLRGLDIVVQGGSAAYGVVDGVRNSVSPRACSSTGMVCDASEVLTIFDSQVVTGGGPVAIAAAALGTGTLNMDGVILTADAQRAWGLLLSDVDGGRLSSLTATAKATRTDAFSEAFAVGISDNFVSPDTPADLGSTSLEIRDSSATAEADGNGIDILLGVSLVGTQASSIEDSEIYVTSDPGFAHTVQHAIGLRLQQVDTVSVDGSSVVLEDLVVSRSAIGVGDGGTDLGSTAATRSRALGLHDLRVGLDLQGNSDALAAGYAMIGTQDLIIDGSYGTGTVNVTVVGVKEVYGVYLTRTDGSVVRGTAIAVAEPIDGTPFPPNVIGVHDGARTSATTDEASHSLAISSNVITLAWGGAPSIGVRLRGNDATSTPTVVDDNFIGGPLTTQLIGVLVQAAPSVIAFNSVRGLGCPGCLTGNPYNVGAYLLHAEGFATAVIANVLSTTTPTDSKLRPAVVKHAAAPAGETPTIGQAVDNVYGCEVDAGLSKLLAVGSNATTAILNVGGTIQYDATQVSNTQGNVAASPRYCGDGIHGDPSGAQYHAATHVSDPYENDIDGQTRPDADLDSGADLIDGPCLL